MQSLHSLFTSVFDNLFASVDGWKWQNSFLDLQEGQKFWLKTDISILWHQANLSCEIPYRINIVSCMLLKIGQSSARSREVKIFVPEFKFFFLDLYSTKFVRVPQIIQRVLPQSPVADYNWNKTHVMSHGPAVEKYWFTWLDSITKINDEDAGNSVIVNWWPVTNSAWVTTSIHLSRYRYRYALSYLCRDQVDIVAEMMCDCEKFMYTAKNYPIVRPQILGHADPPLCSKLYMHNSCFLQRVQINKYPGICGIVIKSQFRDSYGTISAIVITMANVTYLFDLLTPASS